MQNIEGYWRTVQHSVNYDLENSLPWPVENSMSVEGSKKFLKMLGVIEAEAGSIHYKGWSDCRICGKNVGLIEFEYETWNWPVGLRHYIEKHLVKPSNEFIKFIAKEVKRKDINNERRNEKLNDSIIGIKHTSRETNK